LYAASGHHSFADPWAPGEGRREKEKRRVAARTKRRTYEVSKRASKETYEVSKETYQVSKET